jgi:phosphate-selective porin OprO/OprP
MRKHSIGVFVLMVLFLASLAAGQDKKEPPPVTAKRSLQISGYAQFLYTYWESGIDTFSIPRARLGVSGELLKNVRFRIQIDGVKSPALIDAEFDCLFKPYLGLRLGQFYVPFSRENTTSDRDMDTILRSLVVISLAPSRDIGSQGRDIGAMVMGKYSIVEYFAGVFNGSGINKLDTNKKKDLSARLILHPTEYLAVGGSLYTGQHSPTQGSTAVTRDRAGLEAAVLSGKFSLKGELIFGKDEQISKSGWYVQGGYFFYPQKLQAILKWDSYDKDADAVDDRTDLLTFGINWFLLDRTKLMLNYNLYRKEGEGTTNQAISIMFQAAF